MKTKVLIGLSWPYANGRLHIGHVSSSLPADALARYHRQIGNDVSFVTGSDCYGTPILVQAGKEGISPEELANKYHVFHAHDFKSLGFTFDNYDKTLSQRHHDFVKQFHTEMYAGDYIYEKTEPRLYCDKCQKFLPDRYVVGLCPHCKKPAKGDSCDYCSNMLEPEELLEPQCSLCTGVPTPKDQTQMYIKLSAMQEKIQAFLNERKDSWTPNAAGLTQRYLNEGLQDRAITRSMPWGIDIPRQGWDDRKIYIWAENVLGYLSASEPGFIINDGTPKLHYYIHGKDNIPFHGVILPGLLIANGEKYHMPDIIAASEYVMINGEKLSKSKGNYIEAHLLHENFDIDMVRYYFLRTVSEKRDMNFTVEEFVNVINSELVNGFGNLVNRTLSFIKTKFDGKKPQIKMCEKEVRDIIHESGVQWSKNMDAGKVSTSVSSATTLVDFGNKYFADKKPWVDLSKEVIGNVIEIIRNSAVMLAPFIPTACAKVLSWLSHETLPDIEVLWQRLDMNTTKEIFKNG